jgi:ribosomal protein L34
MTIIALMLVRMLTKAFAREETSVGRSCVYERRHQWGAVVCTRGDNSGAQLCVREETPVGRSCVYERRHQWGAVVCTRGDISGAQLFVREETSVGRSFCRRCSFWEALINKS